MFYYLPTLFKFLSNKSKEAQLKGQATQTQANPSYSQQASGDKEINESAFESAIEDRNSEEEWSQSITSNIRHLLEGKSAISPKENVPFPQHVNPHIVDDSDTKANNKEGINRITMDLDKDLMTTKKRDQNYN